MKKTTTHMVATGVSALLATLSTAHADLTFAAPGMNKAQSATGLNVSEQVNLGHYWRYEVSGYEWRLVAGRPTDGKIGADGSLLTNQDTSYKGASSLQVTANNGAVINDASLEATHIENRSGNSVQLTSPIIIKSQVINLGFNQDTNMERDGGSFVAIRGTAIKSPPVPSGDLKVASLVRVDASPDLDWVIRREGSTGTTPTVPNNVTTWSFEMSPGDSSSSVSGSTSTEGEQKATDAPNSGKNRTNNGHGNNADGVDSSNPGKSAEKWNDKFGIIDQSANDDDPTNDDDESTGGGAAPSNK